jgi:hypothetical protein
LPRQAGDEEAHALSGGLALALGGTQPGAHDLADVPGGVVPDPQDGRLAQRSGLRGTAGQKGAGQRAQGTAVAEAPPQGRGAPPPRGTPSTSSPA